MQQSPQSNNATTCNAAHAHVFKMGPACHTLKCRGATWGRLLQASCVHAAAISLMDADANLRAAAIYEQVGLISICVAQLEW